MDPSLRTTDPGTAPGKVFSARDRPLDVPDDLGDTAPITGRVTLPSTIAWSGQGSYDLADRSQLRDVYEQVLREGTGDEIRSFVRASTLLGLGRAVLARPRPPCLGVVGGRPPRKQFVPLSTLQSRIARTLTALPEAGDFALAAGP